MRYIRAGELAQYLLDAHGFLVSDATLLRWRRAVEGLPVGARAFRQAAVEEWFARVMEMQRYSERYSSSVTAPPSSPVQLIHPPDNKPSNSII